jgi:hypothetical protein
MAKKKNTKFTWFEIFKAGKHTDSKGQEAEFTAADLNSVVSNFKPKTAPLVVGHPKMDDPAWGWTSAVKVEGDTLFAQAEEVDQDFAEAVENKRYPNRSVRLRKTANGYELAHIGFLGGAAPAVAGMQWQFNADDDATTFEFASSERIEQLSLDTSTGFVKLIRNLKTLITDRWGSEAADRVFNEWEAESLQQQATIAQHEKQTTEFSAPPTNEDTNVTDAEKKALQDKLAAAEAKNQALEFAQRKADAQTFIDKELNGGKAPRLTKTDGLADFMAQLDGGEATFEFAAADGKTEKANQADWFKGFLKSLPEQTNLTKDFSANEGDADGAGSGAGDAQALASKALDFQQAQAAKGIVISVSQAMAAVNKANAE